MLYNQSIARNMYYDKWSVTFVTRTQTDGVMRTGEGGSDKRVEKIG